MNPLFRAGRPILACLVGLTLTTLAAAADEKPKDAKALDRYLYTNLRFVINHGVDLYNGGRVDEAVDHFRQSLLDLIPILTARPDVQKMIKEELVKVDKDPAWRAKMAAQATMPNPELAPVNRQTAFALRAVFNEVRGALNPDVKKPTPPTSTTLWDRLGGEAGVRKIVDDFAALVGADPKVDITRGGKRPLDELALADLKQKSVEWISSKSGGPLKYTGPSMKAAHKGMGITNEQFDAAAADFRKAMAKNNVKLADMQLVLAVIDSTRKDIVEVKQPGSPKGDVGTVEGTVRLDGKLIARGMVTLTGADGKALSTEVAADGSFKLDGVPLGAYKGSVIGPGVPAAYGNPNTSGITLTVAKGLNQTAFGLKSATKPAEKPKSGATGRPAEATARDTELPPIPVWVLPLDTKPPKVPAAIAAPAGCYLRGEFRATGVQIYGSKAKASGGFEWVLKGVEAELKSDDRIVGKHYFSKDGPVWDLEDEPKKVGELPPKKVDAAPGNIPWLLLKVKDGDDPTYVQRIDTEGGVAPAKAPDKEGEETKVKYKATYLLLAKDSLPPPPAPPPAGAPK